MGVTNLEGNQDGTHVKLAAEFAVDMVNEASQVLIDEDAPDKGYVNVRVGFHCGTVVSNVIGTLNPRYSLFGDTINVASSMESNSGANRILCSDKARQLLKEQAPGMPLREGGKIPIRGKGDMHVFWVGEEHISSGSNTRAVKFQDGPDVQAPPESALVS
jgi:class 3 adenylate cyclase